MKSKGKVLRLVTRTISLQYESPSDFMQTFHCRKIRVFWMWNCGAGWLSAQLFFLNCWTVEGDRAAVIWNVSNFLHSDTASHPRRPASLAIPLWEPQISHSKAFPNFGNFSVSYYSTVLPQIFLTILLQCTIHSHYLISLRIWNSQIQLGLVLKRGSFYDRFTFTTLFESDGTLPTCGASLS